MVESLTSSNGMSTLRVRRIWNHSVSIHVCEGDPITEWLCKERTCLGDHGEKTRRTAIHFAKGLTECKH